MSAGVRPVLGTMAFGDTVTSRDSERILRRFLDAGYVEIDTAHVYNNGETEGILGRALHAPDLPRFSVATKVNPRISGRLDEASITSQLEESLRRLRLSHTDILYLHFPDPATGLEQTLRACASLHQRGLYRELGLSNFSADAVDEASNICTAHKWPRPTVNQGLYNAISRRAEAELIPVLRHHRMKFYAYNPLAGGLLSGRYRCFEGEPGPSRFTARPNYRSRYWTRSSFQAVDRIKVAVEGFDFALSDAALRWLAFHSALDGSKGDGIVLGVSRLDHLTQNLQALQDGPLPEAVVNTFEAAWDLASPESPDYFRFASR